MAMHKKCSQMLIYGAGGQFSVGEQMSLKYPNVLQTQFIWRTAEISGESSNFSDVTLTRGLGIVPPHELFDHHFS